MLLTKVRPSIFIPACEVVWSVLTILLSKCQTAEQIYVLRFFIGLAESSYYPGIQYIIGSWWYVLSCLDPLFRLQISNAMLTYP